jgi:putative membrane protein
MKQYTQDAVNPAEDIVMLDPDVRFLLANERTLLAWVRTGLALLGGGLVLTQLTVADTQTGLGIIAILLGALMAFIGYVRYRAADRAIRASRLPETGRGTTIQVVVVICFALAVVAIELTRSR